MLIARGVRFTERLLLGAVAKKSAAVILDILANLTKLAREGLRIAVFTGDRSKQIAFMGTPVQRSYPPSTTAQRLAPKTAS
jgi:hypothetical protein